MLDATYTGLMNGDTSSVVSSLSLSTTATSTSAVGTYTISTSGGTASNYTITLVNGTLTVNNPVTLTNPGNQTSYDRDTVNLALIASDATSGTLAYSATGLPAGLSISASTGVISGTMKSWADIHSPVTATFTAGDGTYSASQTITWTVNPYPVTLNSPGDQTNYDGDAVNLTLSTSDATSGTLAFTTSGLPAGLSIDSSTGLISGTISGSADLSSTYSTTITASDGTYSASQTVTWAVNNPVTMTYPGAQTTSDGDTINLPISASDALGGTLTFSATSLPTGLSIDSSTGLISGTIDASADLNGPYWTVIAASNGTASANQTMIWTVNNPITVTNPGNQTNYDSARST